MSDTNTDLDQSDSEVLPDQQEPQSESTTEQPRNADGTFTTEREDNETETAASDDAATVSDDETTNEDVEELEEASEKKPAPNQGLIDRLIRQRDAARTRADTLESNLRQFQPQEVDPDLEFENPAAFTQQTIKSALSEERAQAAAQEAQSARLLERQVASQMFQTRVDAVRSDMPDFDQVFDQNVPVSEHAVEVLANSDHGPQIAYHLGKNLGEAHRIANLPPVQQVIELTRLETKVARPPAKRSTNAPKPPRKIGGGSNTSVDPTKMDNDAYRKWRMGQSS